VDVEVGAEVFSRVGTLVEVEVADGAAAGDEVKVGIAVAVGLGRGGR
jgi:hypothetical protein